MGATISNLTAATELAVELTDTAVEPSNHGNHGNHSRKSSIDWNKLYNVTLTDIYGQKILIPVSLWRLAEILLAVRCDKIRFV